MPNIIQPKQLSIKWDNLPLTCVITLMLHLIAPDIMSSQWIRTDQSEYYWMKQTSTNIINHLCIWDVSMVVTDKIKQWKPKHISIFEWIFVKYCFIIHKGTQSGWLLRKFQWQFDTIFYRLSRTSTSGIYYNIGVNLAKVE